MAITEKLQKNSMLNRGKNIALSSLIIKIPRQRKWFKTSLQNSDALLRQPNVIIPYRGSTPRIFYCEICFKPERGNSSFCWLAFLLLYFSLHKVLSGSCLLLKIIIFNRGKKSRSGPKWMHQMPPETRHRSAIILKI